MRNLILSALVLLISFAGCKRSDSYDAEKQLQIDEQLIKDFIAKNSITAERHKSGVYYVITQPGSGNITYYSTTKVKVKYTGRLLNGTVFDQNDGIEFQLGGVITGWQIGVPLIQKGGKIRLLIPSGYAY